MPVRLHRPAAVSACLAIALGLAPLTPAAAEPSSTAETKIVNGRPAAAGAWPAQAALLMAGVPDAFQAQFCGGTLIAADVVLTAAHCVPDAVPEDVEVAVGVVDLATVEETDRTAVDEVLVHEAYDPETNEHDIALLLLAAPVDVPAVQAVAVPGLEPLMAAGTPAQIVGWGGTTSNQGQQQYPSDLQQGDLPVVSDAACASRFAEHGQTITPELMVCAGIGTDEQEDVDTCQGDSGGPLLVVDPRGYRRQIGLTSFGPTCGRTPTAYTELAAEADWIERNTGLDLNTYPDTGAAPFEAAVERAALLGVVTGFSDGFFRPGVDVTREQVASLLARALGVEPTEEDRTGGFADVDGVHRANINALVRLEIVRGVTETSFAPRQPVRRDQMASLLARALGLPPGELGRFRDTRGNTHEGNIGALVEAGVVNGFSDETFRPTLPVARNTMAEFLVRALLADGEVGLD